MKSVPCDTIDSDIFKFDKCLKIEFKKNQS